jgi:hypothetical protein
MKRTDRLTIIIALVLFLAFAAYAGSFAYRALTDQTVTAQAAVASVSVGGSASGIVVRSETVLESDEPYIDVTAGEGERVAAGGDLAMAMSSQTGLERSGRMHELELEIARLTTAVEGVKSADDLTARDSSLRAAVLSLTGAVARQDLSALESASLNLRSLVLEDSGTATEQDLAELQRELDSLRSSSSSDTKMLTAQVSGTFSSVVDGYEHLSPDDLDDLTPDKLRSLIDSRQDAPADAYGKLVTEYYWYFAAAMSAADAANLSTGKYAQLDFGRYYGSPVSGCVVSISPAQDGQVAVVFQCETALADTLAMREVSASVVFEEYSGIRVPSQAIRTDEETESTYVFVITAMQIERKDVNIIYAGEGFCIVERQADSGSLREGNTVVVSGNDLYEGKLME